MAVYAIRVVHGPGYHDSEATPSARDISQTKQFIADCAQAGVQPTVRQARKYRAKYGKWATFQRKATA